MRIYIYTHKQNTYLDNYVVHSSRSLSLSHFTCVAYIDVLDADTTITHMMETGGKRRGPQSLQEGLGFQGPTAMSNKKLRIFHRQWKVP